MSNHQSDWGENHEWMGNQSSSLERDLCGGLPVTLEMGRCLEETAGCQMSLIYIYISWGYQQLGYPPKKMTSSSKKYILVI